MSPLSSWLNHYSVFCRLQGAQLMAQYGIHVPEGIAATTIDGVVEAAAKMKDDKDEV
jgi:succinyl-CoA synthetase beta subunit